MGTLLQQIQESAADAEIPLAALLRKGLILSKRLGYPPLGEWALRELEGYPNGAELPDYRSRRPCQVLGRFEAGLGAGFINPIPSANVEEEHRPILFEFELRKGIAQYEELARQDSLQMPWDQNFVSYYRDAFYPDFALESAWRSISPSELAQMLDAVRTRLLNFALEIEEEDPAAGEAKPGAAHIEPGRVTQIFNQTFHGDNTAFAAAGHSVHQTQNAKVDVEAVRQASDTFGISVEDREQLVAAIEADGGSAGEKTSNWVDRLRLGAITVGTGVTVQTAVAGLSSILGLS